MEQAKAKESRIERRGGGRSPNDLVESLAPVSSEADTLLIF